MGLVQAKLKSRNPRKEEFTAIEVKALVDTGVVHLCIPDIAIQLGLETLEQREVILAGAKRTLSSFRRCGSDCSF